MALYTRRRRPSPTINIVPLVDVLVVLIFFFLMSMRFQESQALDITPPKMDTAGTLGPEQHFIVAVDKAGKYTVDGSAMSADQLKAALKDAGAKKGEALNILIYADEDTPLKNITFVMDESRKLNLNNIRLQTRQQ